MGIFARDPRKEERPDQGGPSLDVDVETKVCPVCRRELHPWEPTCPDHDLAGVDRKDLPGTRLPPPPAHLLDDDPDDAAAV